MKLGLDSQRAGPTRQPEEVKSTTPNLVQGTPALALKAPNTVPKVDVAVLSRQQRTGVDRRQEGFDAGPEIGEAFDAVKAFQNYAMHRLELVVVLKGVGDVHYQLQYVHAAPCRHCRGTYHGGFDVGGVIVQDRQRFAGCRVARTGIGDGTVVKGESRLVQVPVII